jgi:enoyl-CoA hydratase
MELALTGDLIVAERAHELGAVNRLTEPGEALMQTLELARVIAANAPLAVAASKAVITRQASWGEDDFWERQAAIVDPVMASEDAREGARAFTEGRDPRWRSR